MSVIEASGSPVNATVSVLGRFNLNNEIRVIKGLSLDE